MEYMGAFADMFGYTPAEYRALTHRDYLRLKSYVDAQQKERGGS